MTLAMTSATANREAMAQISTWLGNTGSWFDAGNWSSFGGVPHENSFARINNGGTAEILAPRADAEAVELGSNSNHSGALAVRGGALQLRLTGGGLMRVGSLGAGTLTVLDGGSISGRTGQIGAGSLSTGTATVAGLGASWSNIEQLFVGAGGTGTLDILRGGTVSNTVTSGIDTSAILGAVAGGNGTVNVDGLNSKFSNTKDLYIGDGGMGALNVTNRGQVTNFNGNLGVQNSSIGTVSVDGAGSLWKNDSVVAVGISGSGVLNVTAGGAVTSTNGRIARDVGSTGMVSVTGVGSSWTASGDLSVGNSGAGTLAIQNGGRVTNFNGNIGVNGPIGIFTAADGTVTVSGAGSQWINNSVVAVGVNGRGMLSILDGGRVQSTNGRIGREAGSAGTVLIDGPDSRWNASGVFTMGLSGTGTSALEVRNGGVLSAAGGMTIGPLGTVRGDGTIQANVSNTVELSLPAVPAIRPARCTSPAISSNPSAGRCKSSWPQPASTSSMSPARSRWTTRCSARPWAARSKCRWSMTTCRTALSRLTFSIGAAASAASSLQSSCPLSAEHSFGTRRSSTSTAHCRSPDPRIPPAISTTTALSTPPTTSCWRNEIGTPAGYDMWRANFGDGGHWIGCHCWLAQQCRSRRA